jgi:hypothetical protein
MLDCPLISGYAYGSRNQPPVISSANQSRLAKIGAHSLPDCQAPQQLLTIRPPTMQRASLTSLAMNLHNSTLVLVGMIFILSSTLVLQYLCTIVSLYYSRFVLQYTSTIVGLYYSTLVL